MSILLPVVNATLKRVAPGQIFLMKLSYAGGEVLVISGSSGGADGFRVARPRSPGVLDMFPALIYASS